MKWRSTIYLILSLLLAGCVSSCRDSEVRDALVRTEALMESDPRAARAVLDSLNLQSSIFNLPSKEAALYALLRTQADYKCRVRLTSDSLPLIATSYYGTRRKTQRAALAQYYLGCTYSDMSRDLDAIDAFLRATTLFPDTTNKYFAYSFYELGKLYLAHEKDKDALEAFLQYRCSAICQSDSVNIGYADMHLGRTFLYMENVEEAEPFFLKVIDNPYMRKEYHANALFQLAKLNAYLKENYAKAGEYINSYIAGYKQKENIGAAYHIKADVFLHENELDSAFYYYKKVLACKEDARAYCQTYKRLTELSITLCQMDSLDSYFQRYMAFADSVNQIRRDKEISDIENNHVVELHDRELAVQRSRLYWMWGILFTLFVLVTSLVVLWNDRRHKAKALKYEQRLKDIEHRYIQENASIADEEDKEGNELTSASIENASSTSPYFSLQEERLALYRNQYFTSKWAGYFISQQGEMDANGIMPTADSEQFLQYLSELFVNILVDLHRENDRLNRDDMDYCCMTMLGFSINQIAYCCRKPVKYCYNRRTRLGERLTAEWYQFIFGKQPKQA
ncbi:MAG: hypothetical protein IKQ59_06340 [Prevotella sp.]|nr:hypothetical protein [Bacteroidaceae bacterium]MBR6188559.1 hypothetical protein [Prevotella sp.]